MKTAIFAFLLAGFFATGSVNATANKDKPAKAVCADCKDSVKCGTCCESPCTRCNVECCKMKCCK